MKDIDFKLFRVRRKMLTISLKTAAKDIGISHTTLADLENGVKDRILNEKKWKATLKYVAKINKRTEKYVKYWSYQIDLN